MVSLSRRLVVTDRNGQNTPTKAENAMEVVFLRKKDIECSGE